MLADGKVIPSNSDVLQVSYGDDSGLYVEFYHNAVKNEQKSIEAGYAIYENKEYIRIIAAGNKGTTWERPVRKTPNGPVPADTQRFANQWRAFQEGEKQVIDGLPLEQWPAVTPADVKMLKGLGIHTVEQLASIGEHNLTFMGARQYRDKAKTYIENAKGSALSNQLAEQNAKLQDQIEALKNQMNGFINSGVKMEPVKLQSTEEAKAPPKKRGPKPKVKHEQNVPPIDTASG